MSFEVILPNGDRAEADDVGGILLAAATLIEEAATAYGALGVLRKEAYVTRDGVYDNQLTTSIRRGMRVSAQLEANDV